MYHELRKPGTRPARSRDPARRGCRRAPPRRRRQGLGAMPAAPGRRALVRRVFGIPLLLAVATLVGLFAALLGQGGLWHVLAWILLGIPLALLAWCLMRR